jgi:uncharacterized Zn-finger protein
MRMHNGEKPYQCKKCPKSAARLSNLRAHMKNFHGDEKTFKCEKCSECFSLSNDYKRHKKLMIMRNCINAKTAPHLIPA